MRRRWTGALTALAGISLALVGCSAPEPELDPRAAAELQEAVLEVANASAQERYDAAAAAAGVVRTALEEAAEAGEISVSRYARIDAALSRTEAEIAAAAEALDATDGGAAEEPAEQAADDGAAEDASGGSSSSSSGPSSGSSSGETVDDGPGASPPRGPGENNGKGNDKTKD